MNIDFISHFEMIEKRSAKNECKCKNTENQTKPHYRNKYVTLAKHSQQKQNAFRELDGCSRYVFH